VFRDTCGVIQIFDQKEYVVKRRREKRKENITKFIVRMRWKTPL
jgi:hypothetical protein